MRITHIRIQNSTLKVSDNKAPGRSFMATPGVIRHATTKPPHRSTKNHQTPSEVSQRNPE
ncbi:MAG: hypothetical protein EA390_05755 [Balneolaceae bacterium]|nr:MAG: hypothetical protein EA390_05755 [Balneolaceae bacterium]